LCKRRNKKDKKEEIKLDDAKKEEVIDNVERENLLLYKTQGGLEIDEVYLKCFTIHSALFDEAHIFSLKSFIFKICYWNFMIKAYSLFFFF
jgi:hypothetical protein